MQPKLSTYSLAALSAIGALLFTGGCKQEEFTGPGVYGNSVTGVIAQDNNFSLFNAALDKAELVRPLNDAGPFTVFAPTDAALRAANISATTVDTVASRLGKEELMGLLTYHMLGGQSLQSVANTDSATTNFATLNGKQFFVTQSERGMVVNGARVLEAKQALNGVTYSVDKFLAVPGNDLVQALGADPRFSILAKAVTAAGLASELGKNNVGYGVFAPTNAAFEAAGITEANVADVPNLADVLRYHLTPRVYFSGNLTPGAAQTLLGKTRRLVINTGAGVTITDETGGTATVTQADLVTSNGVVHVIDRVLMPAM